MGFYERTSATWPDASKSQHLNNPKKKLHTSVVALSESLHTNSGIENIVGVHKIYQKLGKCSARKIFFQSHHVYTNNVFNAQFHV